MQAQQQTTMEDMIYLSKMLKMNFNIFKRKEKPEPLDCYARINYLETKIINYKRKIAEIEKETNAQEEYIDLLEKKIKRLGGKL